MVAMAAENNNKGWRKGPWTHEEDKLLSEYITLHGEGRWSSVSKFTGMNRSGKSCRLRWVNYLRPGLKKGHLTPLEEGTIIELHAILGNKWSTIAKYLPGRTDNEIKNYWRTHFGKKEKPKHKKTKQERQKPPKAKVPKQLKRLEQQPPQELKSINEGTKNETKSSETCDNNMEQQDMSFMCPTMIDQQNGNHKFSSTWQDDGLWFGLWEFNDDPQGFVDNVNQCSKWVMPNEATFGIGDCGDSMQNYQDSSCFDYAWDNLFYGKYLFG